MNELMILRGYKNRMAELEKIIEDHEQEKVRIIEYCQKEVCLCDKEIESTKRILKLYQTDEND